MIDIIKMQSLLVMHVTVTGFRLCIASSVITSVVVVGLAVTVRSGMEVEDTASEHRVVVAEPKAESLDESERERLNEVTSEKNENEPTPTKQSPTNPLAVLRTVCSLRSFWKFFFLSMVMVPGKLPLSYNNAMLPKWLPREHGRDVPFGTIISINWTLCVLLPPLLAAATRMWGHFDTLLLGMYFCGLGTFLLAASPTLPVIVIWEAIITTGECLFTVRMYTLAGELAPKGMEATL